MYRIPISFHNRLMRGEIPIPYIVIQTHMGYRAYAEKELGETFSGLGYIADGTYTADGSITAGGGGAGVIDKSARVIEFGAFERSLQAVKDDVITAFSSKTLQSISIDLDNADAYFSQLIASEPFIGRPLQAYVGFESLPQAEHVKVFSGIITEMNVIEILTIEANEE